tara:strand:- start:133 stop:453 length:321 start_codon:yes stop_codon:yes gene_type:complete
MIEGWEWIVAAITTGLALKKDWILSKFIKSDKELEQAATMESVESAQLANVEQEITIYRGIVADLKGEIVEMRAFIEEQKTFIRKQAKSLDYYEKKCNNCPTANKY